MRGAQSGFVRSYALLLVGGFAGARPLLPGGERADAQRPALAAARRRRCWRCCCRAGAAGGSRCSARWWRSGWRSRSSPTSTPAAAGLQHVVDESWIPDLGVRYQLGVDGISVFLVLLTAVLWFAATLWSALRGAGRRARAHFFLRRARRDGGARRVHGPGPAAVRPLLRPDADPVLLPVRDLRRTANRIAGDDQDDRLHAGRLAADAGRARSRPRPRRGPAASSPSRSRRCGRTRSATGTQDWIFCFFAAAFLVKMPAFPSTAGCPTPTARRRCRSWCCSRRCSRRSAPTASCGWCCRSSPTPRSHFQEVILIIALASILYGSVMAFTQTNVRLIAGYSSVAQLGFITLGIFSLRPDGADGAVLQMVNHGLVVGGDLHDHRDRSSRAPQTDDITKMGGHGDARAGARRAVPDRDHGAPGDPRLGQLRRRVLHPQRRLPVEDRARLRSPRSASRWPPSTRCASTSGRCTTGCPRGSSRARSRSARASSSRRWSPDRRARALPRADPRARRGR